jgi:two-component system cell cycle sensor histidine kinase/response regulator CckA
LLERILKRFAAFLTSKRAELAGLLQSHFQNSVYDNRAALHPRNVSSMSDDVADSFIRFIETSRGDGASSNGAAFAEKGVGEGVLISLFPLLKEFCEELSQKVAKEEVDGLSDAVDRYASLILEGYIQAREAQILTDQEQLRRALATALQLQSRELLVKNHAINTSINGIMLADLGGRVTYVNPSFLAMWGYNSAADALGAHMADFWAGDEAHKIIENLPRTGGWRGELAAQRGDGAVLTVSLVASLIRNESDTPIGIMASFVDVTESRRLEAQIQQVQKMDALGQLAGGIAHDFNNLLTAIIGYLQLLLTDAPPGSQMHQDLMQIKAAADRGAGLTKQLRYFTRQASGRRQTLNLNDVAMETYELLRHTFAPEIAINIELSGNPCTIAADSNQMSQILVNLCVNARDAIIERGVASPGKPPSGTVSIETANLELTESQARKFVNITPGKYVLLKVSDTGVGMPPELIERLFIPFLTTKTARRGTGLGLAVVYGIVRSHRGFIDVKSEQGKGSVFSVYIPAAECRDPDETMAASDAVFVKGRGTVLVVDDESQVRDVMSRVLTSSGYNVLEVENGNSALNLFRERGKDIDLIVLDVVMPAMGGPETFLRLKEMDPTVSVLVVTGFTTNGIAHELLDNGADGFVEKPLDLKVFTDKVKELTGRSRARRGN